MPFLIRLLLITLGGGALVRWLTGRRWKQAYPDPDSMVTEPEVDYTLSRQPNGDLLLRWSGERAPTSIYGGHSPDVIDRATALSADIDTNSMTISNLSPEIRHYIEIVYQNQAGDERREVLAERVLPLQGVANFRDIGGYRTEDGKQVRWGQVFRSGSLASLTPADQQYLTSLGIKLVCDLRSGDEISEEPDQLPDTIEYLHMPLYNPNNARRALHTLILDRRRLDRFMQEAYKQIIVEENAALFGGLLTRLADPAQRPAVVHCTAGKDRTGIGVALLLRLLGVPEAVVVADYTLSNLYFDHFKAITWKRARALRWFGVMPDDLIPLFTAQAATMQAALDHIEASYGSVEGYLRNAAGLGDDAITQLRSQLLVEG